MLYGFKKNDKHFPYKLYSNLLIKKLFLYYEADKCSEISEVEVISDWVEINRKDIRIVAKDYERIVKMRKAEFFFYLCNKTNVELENTHQILLLSFIDCEGNISFIQKRIFMLIGKALTFALLQCIGEEHSLFRCCRNKANELLKNVQELQWTFE